MNASKLKYWFSIILLSIIGSLFFLSYFGTINFNFEALEFKVGLQIFDRGFTDINIPPIGTVKAKTHLSPVKISITLQNIDLKLLQNLLETIPEKEKLLTDFENRVSKVTKLYLIRLLFVAILGGMVGSFLLVRKKLKPLLLGALVGVLIYTILMISTITTYDTNAFQNPEYQGVLEAAPWMMGLVEQAFVQLHTLGQQLELMAENFYVLFEKINTMETLSTSEGTVKVLHVSDLHNNQAALKFVTQIVRSFNVDFVIDSGDLTDFATPLEVQILEYLENMPVPYLFVAGNHDAPSIIKKLKEFPQIKILNEGMMEMVGLRILGIHDPASLTNKIVPPDTEMVSDYQNKLIEMWNENPQNPPDIVVVHNYRIAEILAGKASLILHGHDHGYKIYQDKETLVVDAGTTGAAGIRGLQATKEIPYTVVLLHFQKEEENFKLTALDTIKVFNLQSGFTLERQVLD